MVERCAYCHAPLGNSRHWYEGSYYHPTCNPQTNVVELQDRIAALKAQLAELAAENERLKQEAAEWEVIARAKSEEALTHRREAEAMMSALANASLASTGAVKEAGAELAKAAFGVDLVPTLPEGHHHDDLAVDRFAAAMKAKLARKRDEGRGGWSDKEICSEEYLSRLLHEHVQKGDPLDVGNLAMMLHQRGERISPEGQQEPVAWLTNLGWIDSPRYTVSFDGDKSGCDNFPVYTRPSEQAMTEAMVEAVAHVIEMAIMRHGVNEPDIQGTKDDAIDALKAAMEAGHD